MLLGREMRAGGGRSTTSGGRWSSEHGGGVVPMGVGRGEGGQGGEVGQGEPADGVEVKDWGLDGARRR